MYVIPFFSHRPTTDGVLIKNWLTRQMCVKPPAFLESLGRIHEGHAAGGDADLAEMRELELVFDSREAAEVFYVEQERRWETAAPTIDQIELTNRCPYSCRMCPRTLSMDRALGDMPLELFERLLGEIRGRQTYVALHHFGESLVYRDLPEAVSMARASAVKTGLSCNPPSLHPALAQRLLEAGIANIVLSLDSLNEATYRRIRGRVAIFDRADRHLRELVRLRNEGGFSTFISLQMIRMHDNADEADQFLDYCREVGVNRGVVIRFGRWDFDDETATELGELTSPGYEAWCSRPWTSLVVLWDGRVVPCCHDYNGAVVLGDLKTESLDAIWNGEPARRFRTQNQDYELCRNCAFSRYGRERQREQEGFMRFHRERGGTGSKQWQNPESTPSGRELFDGFDVWTAEPEPLVARGQ